MYCSSHDWCTDTSKTSLLKWVGHFGAKYLVQGLHLPPTYIPLDRGMVLLQRCRWKFSQKETSYQSLFCLNWFLLTKMTNLLFEPPFGGLSGNVWTSSIARWKARSWLPIRDNWTFFASSYGWDVISRYWSKLVLFLSLIHIWRCRRRG